MRDIFFNTLTEHAQKNKNIIWLVADRGFKVIDRFKSVNPKQFFNVGIAEQNMAGIATGLALSGKKVFCYSIANFTALRSIEHIRNGACYHNLDIKFVSGGSGYSYGSLGYTHHAIEDLAIMRSLPNMTVLSPSCDDEIDYITKYLCKNDNKPTYLRIDKSKISIPLEQKKIKSIIIPRPIIKEKDEDVIILSTGGILNEAKEAVNYVKKFGIKCTIYSVFNLSFICKKFLKKIVNKKILIIEETIKENGLFHFIRDNSENNNIYSISINKNNIYYYAGTQQHIRNKQKISKPHIIKKIQYLYKQKCIY
jgi:transketolase